MQLIAVRLLTAALPALDPLSSSHAQEVAHYFLQQAGEGLAGLAFSHVKKVVDEKGKGKEKEDEPSPEDEKDVSARLYKASIISQVVVTSLRTLLYSESPASTNWRLHLSKWLGRVANQDLPRVLSLLSDPSNPVEVAASKKKKDEIVESFHDVLTCLSLLGGNISSPLPGAKVELKVFLFVWFLLFFSFLHIQLFLFDMFFILFFCIEFLYIYIYRRSQEGEAVLWA